MTIKKTPFFLGLTKSTKDSSLSKPKVPEILQLTNSELIKNAVDRFYC